MADEIENGKKTDMSAMKFIVLLMVLMIVAAGGGFGVSNFLITGTSQSAETAPDEDEEKSSKDTSDLKIIALAPITTNLAKPNETWVRAELAIAVSQEMDELVLADLQTNIVAYFRTVSLETFRSPSGFQHLVSDLEERASFFSDGKAERVFITSLVFE